MPTVDPRIDAYIDKAGDFAKPVLTHVRKLVHETCPDVVETLKWSMPSLEYKGILCGFASFKAHCTLMFWKQSLLESDSFPKNKTAMGSFGRITSLKDLPSDQVLTGLIRQAMELNEKGVKVPPKAAAAKREVVVPEVLREALARNGKAAETFDNFPPGAKREYVEWITDAKTDATRDRRIATTVEWLEEGKRRNWKYEKC